MASSYAELMQLANAYSESQTVLTANELGVFTAIGKGAKTAPRIARDLRLDPEGTRLLLDALVGLDLLTLSGGRYRNAPITKKYLDGRSPQAITNLLWLLGHHWHDWSNLRHALRKGRPGWGQTTDSREFRRRFSMAMHERSHALAAPTVATMRLPSGARRFLDLGGGPGSYAIALAKRYPRLDGVVMDRTVSVTRRLIQHARLEKRLKARAGDIFKDDLGSGYDAVVVSNVIHVFNEKENERLLKRVRAALNPGGRIFIVEFFLDRSRTKPPKSAVFSVMMYLFTATGRCYSWEETEAWLKALRFGQFRRHTVTSDIGTLEATRL